MSYYDRTKQELLNLLTDFKNSSKTFDESFQRLEAQERGVNQLAKERQIGFPWLAKAYEEFFKLQDKSIIDFLQYKKHSAVSASLIVKEQSRLRRQAEREKKIAQYLVEYYENIAPFLLELKEEVDQFDSFRDIECGPRGYAQARDIVRRTRLSHESFRNRA